MTFVGADFNGNARASWVKVAAGRKYLHNNNMNDNNKQKRSRDRFQDVCKCISIFIFNKTGEKNIETLKCVSRSGSDVSLKSMCDVRDTTAENRTQTPLSICLKIIFRRKFCPWRENARARRTPQAWVNAKKEWKNHEKSFFHSDFNLVSLLTMVN